MARLTKTKDVVQTATHETETLTYSTEPDYIKVYLKDLMYLSDLPDRYTRILYALLPRASWAKDGMMVVVTSGLKRLICKELDLKSVQTISNALSQMSKAGILKRIETGVYALNPLLFGKGDWRDIQALRLKVDYTLQGKTFKAFLNYKKRGEINITPKPEQLEEGKGGSLNDGNGTAEESGASS